MGLVRAIVICAVVALTTAKPFDTKSSNIILLGKTPGETVLFDAFWHQVPLTSISWNILNTIIINTSLGLDDYTNPDYADRITLFSNGSLELRNLTLEDTGDYTVTITPKEHPTFQKEYLLRVYEPVSDVRVSVSASDLIEDRSSVNLTCSASGTYLSFAWYNRTNRLPCPTPVLTLTTVTRYDTGPFRCVAYNLIGLVQSEYVSLTISYGPDVTLRTFPSQEFYFEGSTVTMQCLVDSIPEAEISWSFGGDLLPFSGAQLVLRNLASTDSGSYRCTAFNHKTRLYGISRPAVIFVAVQLPDETVFRLPDRIIVGIAIICISGFGTAAGFAFLYKRKRMLRRARRAREAFT